MDHELFIKNYLKPSADGLDRSFTLPLPEISGLKPCGEFIVQGHLDDTFSTNNLVMIPDSAGVFDIISKQKAKKVHSVYCQC